MKSKKRSVNELVAEMIINEFGHQIGVDIKVVDVLTARVLNTLRHPPSSYKGSKFNKPRIRSTIRFHYMLMRRAGEITLTESNWLVIPSQDGNTQKSPQLQPPLKAEFFLHLLLRDEEQDAFIGCLVERYGRKVGRLGKRRADIWFYFEIVRSACPLIRRLAVKIVKLVMLGEWFRRMIQ